MIRPFILCGGSGSRLWPISTSGRPKQFHALSGARSMISETAIRLPDAVDGMELAPAVAVGGVRWRQELSVHLPDAPQILEPLARNSGPAVAAAALCADADDIILIMPSDHHIADISAFHEALVRGAEAARQNALVTFGIRPDHAATGYGYIELSSVESVDERVALAKRFVEKPTLSVAEAYLASGLHLWNAGIFLFRAKDMISLLEHNAPDILDAVRKSMPENGPLKPREARLLDREHFASAPSISIDYAVLEKADRVLVVPVSMGWSDLGDFRALKALYGLEGRSVIIGPAVEEECSANFIFSSGPRIAVKGLSEVAIVASPDGVLVTAIDQAPEIREVVKSADRIYPPNLDAAVAERTRNWLTKQMLPKWALRGWDDVNRGFVETLSYDGVANLDTPRRGRVAPRQLFTFATALMHGWDEGGAASRLVDQGLDFLNGPARSPRGGWAHKLHGSGGVADARRDLYDHAFVAIGAARAFQAIGEERAERIAIEAFGLIDEVMRDGLPGWASPETARGLKQSNPHMHFLEANLIWFEASGDADAGARIETIAMLFEAFMFDPAKNVVGEEFDSDWGRATGEAGSRIEPGHCYEWAWLLAEVQRLTGRDTASWSRRLIDFADNQGLGLDGFSYDAVTAEGDVLRSTRRAWPQLERIRARLRFPETAPPGEASREIDAFLSRYVNEDGYTWNDCLDESGNVISGELPASMPYHFVTALIEV